MNTDKPITIYCDACTKRIDPVLTPGEDFTQVNCPDCGKDLTLVWYSSNQLRENTRWAKWIVPGIIIGMAIMWLASSIRTS